MPFTRVGHIPSVAAAVRVAAHSAPVLVHQFESHCAHPWVGPPNDPFEYRWRRVLLQVCGATMCFLFGAGLFLGAKIDKTSTQSAGTGGGAGCCRGGWFRRCPLESSTCRGPKSRSPRVSNPPHQTTKDYRSRYWAVYVSYQFPSSATWRGVFPGRGRTCGRGASCGRVCMGVLERRRHLDGCDTLRAFSAAGRCCVRGERVCVRGVKVNPGE